MYVCISEGECHNVRREPVRPVEPAKDNITGKLTYGEHCVIAHTQRDSEGRLWGEMLNNHWTQIADETGAEFLVMCNPPEARQTNGARLVRDPRDKATQVDAPEPAPAPRAQLVKSQDRRDSPRLSPPRSVEDAASVPPSAPIWRGDLSPQTGEPQTCHLVLEPDDISNRADAQARHRPGVLQRYRPADTRASGTIPSSMSAQRAHQARKQDLSPYHTRRSAASHAASMPLEGDAAVTNPLSIFSPPRPELELAPVQAATDGVGPGRRIPFHRLSELASPPRPPAPRADSASQRSRGEESALDLLDPDN